MVLSRSWASKWADSYIVYSALFPPAGGSANVQFNFTTRLTPGPESSRFVQLEQGQLRVATPSRRQPLSGRVSTVAEITRPLPVELTGTVTRLPSAAAPARADAASVLHWR